MQMLYRLSYEGATVWFCERLRSILERETGFEPATLSLEG